MSKRSPASPSPSRVQMTFPKNWVESLRVDTTEALASKKEAKRLLIWLRTEHGPVDVYKEELPPEINVVHLGACLDHLQNLPDNCVDLICTDPPYGLTSVNPKKPGGGGIGSTGFMGKKWDAAVPPVAVWEECLRVLKPGAFAFVMSSPRQDCVSQMILNLKEAGFVIGFTSLYYVFSSGLPKAQNLSKAVDKRAGAKRKEAHRLEGSFSGFQPKPALEPILVVMKPLDENTYLDQALKNGKGCTWLGNCRIPVGKKDASRIEKKNPHTKGGFVGGYGGAAEAVLYKSVKEGRFPANVLVEDDALQDDIVRSSCRSTKKHKAYKGESTTKMLRGDSSPDNQYADSGSPSRYFDLDAWFTERVKKLPTEVQKVFPNLLVPKPSRSEKNAGLDEPNPHPQ